MACEIKENVADEASVLKAGEETLIVIMLKDAVTGFLERELLALKIKEHESLIVNIFAAQRQDGQMMAHMKLTTDRDVEDWEFTAIYDYYDSDRLAPAAAQVSELEDCYNPTWEIVFPFVDEAADMECKLMEILKLHLSELQDVYDAIQADGVRAEYEHIN